MPYRWYFHWLNSNLKWQLCLVKIFVKFIAKTTKSGIGRGYTYPNYTNWPRTVSSCWLKRDYRLYQNWFDENWSKSSRCAMVRTLWQYYYGATPCDHIGGATSLWAWMLVARALACRWFMHRERHWDRKQAHWSWGNGESPTGRYI